MPDCAIDRNFGDQSCSPRILGLKFAGQVRRTMLRAMNIPTGVKSRLRLEWLGFGLPFLRRKG